VADSKDDVEALRRRVAELERERELLNAVANYAPSLLCLVGGDGRVRPRATNQAFERVLGYEPEDTGGVLFWERYVPEDDRDDVEAAIRRVIGSGAAEEWDGRWLTRAGDVVEVAWSCTPLPMIESGPVFLISAADITERNRHAEEVRRSRTRIVAAADEARRRLERNLHDGAQQHLIAALLALRTTRSKVVGTSPLAPLLDRAVAECAAAVDELRELARGIHPVVLTEQGLATALRMVAGRASFPVELDVPARRFPEDVEAAAYYVVSEALVNVTKHAEAASASVQIREEGTMLLVTVADDGRGGADPEGGSGLRGLVDRVAALDGSLTWTSPPGAGTRLEAALPLVDTRGA
jgi:PAS domain S-box-containing protein